jgi:acyl carrier protein
MADVFDRVKAVVVRQLKVQPDEVTAEANLIDDLRADSLDIVDLTIAIEEEFAGDADIGRALMLGRNATLSRRDRERRSAGSLRWAFPGGQWHDPRPEAAAATRRGRDQAATGGHGYAVVVECGHLSLGATCDGAGGRSCEG